LLREAWLVAGLVLWAASWRMTEAIPLAADRAQFLSYIPQKKSAQDRLRQILTSPVQVAHVQEPRDCSRARR
jgi:hypothetical protein